MSHPPFWQQDEAGDDSFWPSFTDIMMVILMTFLLVTVAVIVANTRLLKDLRSSVAAEREANQLAEFTLKENATLEEQLDYYRQQLSVTEREWVRSRATNEQLKADLVASQAALGSAKAQVTSQADSLVQREQEMLTLQGDLAIQTTETERLQDELKQVQKTHTVESQRLQGALDKVQGSLGQVQADLEKSRAEITAKETTLAELQSKVDAGQEQLASLEGEYSALDKKYQKLLKPTRSDKGKTVVEVMYQRSGHSVRKPGEFNYRSVSTSELERELGELKTKYGTELYVKIIIPENSGLSYNQAWAFTRDTLGKYDYYYQADASEPVEGVDGAEGIQ